MTDRFSVAGANAIVTGASGGLGRHFALVLARAGANVALAARRLDRLQALAREIEGCGGHAMAVALDVTDRASVQQAVTGVVERFARIDLLVNNSGLLVTKRLLEHTEADWRSVIDTNLTGAWFMALEVGRHMVSHGEGGNIINVASVAGLRTFRHLPGYAASKAGLIHLTKTLAVELARDRIRVNALAPTYIETALNRDFFALEAGKKLTARIPLARPGQPDDLDGPLLFLASDASRYVTGHVLVVDGGHSVAPI